MWSIVCVHLKIVADLEREGAHIANCDDIVEA